MISTLCREMTEIGSVSINTEPMNVIFECSQKDLKVLRIIPGGVVSGHC